LISVPPARLQAEPVERLLPKRALDHLAEIRRNDELAGLERPRERAFELAFGIGLVERLAADADPGASSGRAGADVGGDPAVRAEGEPDQLLPRASAARNNAGALRLLVPRRRPGPWSADRRCFRTALDPGLRRGTCYL
jgi:hypothetical protein